MASFNRIIIMGNATRDPQMKHLQGGQTVTELGLACNRRYKTKDGEAKDDVCFVDVAFFGKQAEIINQYVTKGKPLMVEGRLKFDSWDDKSGCKRSKLSIVGENFQFIPDGKGGGGQNEPASVLSGATEVDPDSIPF